MWEANHVWLIFVLVILWTGFPEAFAAIASSLYVPLTLVATGVILRGAGFAFRKEVTGVRLERLFGATFAASSVITPFFLGTVAGAIASGRVPAGIAEAHPVRSFVNPTSVLGGALAVVVCAYLAAVYLTGDAHRSGEDELVEAFRRRALASGAVAGAMVLGGIGILHADAPELFDGLTTGRGRPLVAVSVLAGLASLGCVWKGRFVMARLASAAAVTAVLWGWAAGQYPDLLHRRADDRRGGGGAGRPSGGAAVVGRRGGTRAARPGRALPSGPARGGRRLGADGLETVALSGGSGGLGGHFPCPTRVLKRYPRNFSEEIGRKPENPETLVP